jgi:hypothetical protein
VITHTFTTGTATLTDGAGAKLVLEDSAAQLCGEVCAIPSMTNAEAQRMADAYNRALARKIALHPTQIRDLQADLANVTAAIPGPVYAPPPRTGNRAQRRARRRTT